MAALGTMPLVPAPTVAATPTHQLTTPSEVAAAVEQARSRGADVALALDVPRTGETVAGRVVINGWAADLRAGGAGVEPNSFEVRLESPQTSQVLGLARSAQQRPDVAALIGKPPSTTRNFTLGWETCSFPPGRYRLTAAAAAQDTVTSYSTTADLTVAPCPTATDSPLFQDPLDGSIPQWTIGRFNWCTYEYSDGEYRVSSRPANPYGGCADPDTLKTVFQDFVLEVDARVLDPTPSGAARVGFRGITKVIREPRWQQFGSGYGVQLFPATRTVGLVYDDGTTDHAIAESHSDAVRSGDAVNHLTVRAVGSRLSVLVNGDVALDLEDDRLPWGMIMLGADAPPGQTATAAFSNLAIYRAKRN